MADVSNNYIAKAIYLASKENPDDLASRVVKFLAKKKTFVSRTRHNPTT
jgi:hypothetical protein